MMQTSQVCSMCILIAGLTKLEPKDRQIITMHLRYQHQIPAWDAERMK